jgi:hypothetical protein
MHPGSCTTSCARPWSAKEELDCAERGRTSHLNPLRAGIGADGRELNRSPDGGHSAVVGEAEWVEAILK